MPLIQSKSKKAVSKNIEREMDAGKPQKQSIAIALDVQRRNKRKKMAKGGPVEISAHDEKRPMPEQEFADSMEDSRVHEKPAAYRDHWTGGDHRTEALSGESAPASDIEVDARDEHMSGIDDAITPEEMAMIRRHRMAKGGMAMQHANESNPSSPESPHEEMHIEDAAIRMNERERQRDMLAYGGNPKLEESHKSPSVSEAIMRKRKMYAEGGEVADVSRNADEDPNMEDQMSFEALKKENYSESEGLDELDSPMDSNEHGDDIAADEHDMVSQIRRKMKSGRPQR
jgi:hypothetical protein